MMRTFNVKQNNAPHLRFSLCFLMYLFLQNKNNLKICMGIHLNLACVEKHGTRNIDENNIS